MRKKYTQGLTCWTWFLAWIETVENVCLVQLSNTTESVLKSPQTELIKIRTDRAANINFVPANKGLCSLLSQTGEKREICHFHYTTWPDFGVPESPASFLNFLFKVRESGALEVEHGPAVVHCSAGIGRSGTFSLVDTCVVLVSPAS